MPPDIEEKENDGPLELPPPPKRKMPKGGRPKGRKNTSTLQREHREKVAAKAQAMLDKGSMVSKNGKKYVDVSQLCVDLNFDPVNEAICLFREIEADHLDSDSRKLRIDILKLILPYYAPKLKAPEDGSTSREVPIFNVFLGESHQGRAMIDVTPRQTPTVSEGVEIHLAAEPEEGGNQ